MKLKKLLILLSGGAIAFAPLTAQAQPMTSGVQSNVQAPASTFHPGSWQPITRINPDQPFQLVVDNQSDLPLEYSLTTGATRSMAAHSKASLNSVAVPTHILIYSPVANSSLQYTVSSVSNTIFVKVQQKATDIPGNSSLAVNQSGAVYVY